MRSRPCSPRTHREVLLRPRASGGLALKSSKDRAAKRAILALEALLRERPWAELRPECLIALELDGHPLCFAQVVAEPGKGMGLCLGEGETALQDFANELAFAAALTLNPEGLVALSRPLVGHLEAVRTSWGVPHHLRAVAERTSGFSERREDQGPLFGRMQRDGSGARAPNSDELELLAQALEILSAGFSAFPFFEESAPWYEVPEALPTLRMGPDGVELVRSDVRPLTKGVELELRSKDLSRVLGSTQSQHRLRIALRRDAEKLVPTLCLLDAASSKVLLEVVAATPAEARSAIFLAEAIRDLGMEWGELDFLPAELVFEDPDHARHLGPACERLSIRVLVEAAMSPPQPKHIDAPAFRSDLTMTIETLQKADHRLVRYVHDTRWRFIDEPHLIFTPFADLLDAMARGLDLSLRWPRPFIDAQFAYLWQLPLIGNAGPRWVDRELTRKGWQGAERSILEAIAANQRVFARVLESDDDGLIIIEDVFLGHRERVVLLCRDFLPNVGDTMGLFLYRIAHPKLILGRIISPLLTPAGAAHFKPLLRCPTEPAGQANTLPETFAALFPGPKLAADQAHPHQTFYAHQRVVEAPPSASRP